MGLTIIKFSVKSGTPLGGYSNVPAGLPALSALRFLVLAACQAAGLAPPAPRTSSGQDPRKNFPRDRRHLWTRSGDGAPTAPGQCKADHRRLAERPGCELAGAAQSRLSRERDHPGGVQCRTCHVG